MSRLCQQNPGLGLAFGVCIALFMLGMAASCHPAPPHPSPEIILAQVESVRFEPDHGSNLLVFTFKANTRRLLYTAQIPFHASEDDAEDRRSRYLFQYLQPGMGVWVSAGTDGIVRQVWMEGEKP